MPRASGCSRRRRSACKGPCVVDGRKKCRQRTPCSMASNDQCQNNHVKGCEWRRWSARSRNDGCYPSKQLPLVTFRVGRSYKCFLHPMRCVALIGDNRRCNLWTHLHPLCPWHARRDLGVQVRPSGRTGCGLYATRSFEKNDLICPYLGAKRPIDDWKCPHPQRQGDTDAPSSGYSLDVDGARSGGSAYQLDASCHRSYGSMANHAPQSQTNADFVLMRDLTYRNVGVSDPNGRCNVRESRPAVRTGPSILLRSRVTDPESVGMGVSGSVWLRANRRIHVGDEILVCYGGSAGHINSVQHTTTPALC